jgi:hypothetical protein
MTIGQVILLAVVPLGALCMLAFSHFLTKWMPPTRSLQTPAATKPPGAPSQGLSR